MTNEEAFDWLQRGFALKTNKDQDLSDLFEYCKTRDVLLGFTVINYKNAWYIWSYEFYIELHTLVSCEKFLTVVDTPSIHSVPYQPQKSINIDFMELL